MSVTALQLYTTTITCSASTTATRLAGTTSRLDYQAVTILAKNSNAGTLYISGQANATRSGFPLTKGQSLDLGPCPMGGKTWYGVDPSSVYVFSTAGASDKVILHSLRRNESA